MVPKLLSSFFAGPSCPSPFRGEGGGSHARGAEVAEFGPLLTLCTLRCRGLPRGWVGKAIGSLGACSASWVGGPVELFAMLPTCKSLSPGSWFLMRSPLGWVAEGKHKLCFSSSCWG